MKRAKVLGPAAMRAPTRDESYVLMDLGFTDPTRMPTVQDLERRIAELRGIRTWEAVNVVAWCLDAKRRLEVGAASPFQARLPEEIP